MTTVVVSPVGTPTDNGTALLAAMAGITDASASKPYVLKLEPGLYDLGSTTMVAKAFIDIEGSGRDITTIQNAANAATPSFASTLQITTDVEVRSLTIRQNDLPGAVVSSSTVAVSLDGDIAPRLTDLNVVVSGQSSSSLTGIRGFNRSSPIITDVAVNVSSGMNSNVNGILVTDPSLLQHVPLLQRVSVTTATVNANLNAPIYLLRTSAATLQQVTAIASSSAGNAYGLYIQDGSATLDDVVGRASGATINTGMYVTTSAAATVTVRNSKLSGGNSAVANSSTGITVIVNIAASELDGTALKGGAGTQTFNCVGDYTSAFAAYTCP